MSMFYGSLFTDKTTIYYYACPGLFWKDEYLIDATRDTITYKGIGYKIEVRYYENGIERVEMKMFDKVISASIT